MRPVLFQATRGRARRIPELPMRVPGGRDVRQAPAIGGYRDKDMDLCVYTHRSTSLSV